MKQKLLKILYKFLAFCARVYLARTKPFVIWVTGSVWKTNCRQVIAQVLEQVQSEKTIYTSPKNYNSELGLIFSIFTIEDYDPSIKNLLKVSWEIFKKSLLQKKQYDILVAEYGIDTSGDMDFLISLMKPDVWILTKLDSVHSDNFDRGISELWEDKFKLLLASKNKSYFNNQDDFLKQHEHLLSKPHEKTFIKTPKTKLEKSENGLKQSFIYNKKNISINLLWEENVEYTILAFKIANDIWVKFTDSKYSFDYTIQAGRFSIFQRNENIFIDSSYNAGPESMKKIIENTKLVQKELYPEHKIIYVLWDMREIWEARKAAHISLWDSILKAAAIMLIGTDLYTYTLPKLKQNGFLGDIHSSLSSREVGKYLKKYLKDNSENKYIILFKGSQNTIFTEEALAPQLLASQQKYIPRQSQDWKSKKDDFFKSL
jgi:UDP-N-acetylmuramoyl-tripeptide--D-alanyl-D-alanine ligase